MSFLGVDYGRSHVGLAFAEASLSQPLTTVPTKNIFPYLINLIKARGIKVIVVGLPEGKIKPDVQDFVSDLTDLGYLVHTHDETLSSQDARQALLHKSRHQRSAKEHSAAAAIILQSWLDSISQNQ